MESRGTIGLIIFGAYLLVVVTLGLVAARYQQTEEDFWVAGRRFGLVILLVANMAAIMHGGSILSGSAFAGQFGGVAALPYLSFTLGFAVLYYSFSRKSCACPAIILYPISWAIGSTVYSCEGGAPW